MSPAKAMHSSRERSPASATNPTICHRKARWRRRVKWEGAQQEDSQADFPQAVTHPANCRHRGILKAWCFLWAFLVFWSFLVRFVLLVLERHLTSWRFDDRQSLRACTASVVKKKTSRNQTGPPRRSKVNAISCHWHENCLFSKRSISPSLLVVFFVVPFRVLFVFRFVLFRL